MKRYFINEDLDTISNIHSIGQYKEGIKRNYAVDKNIKSIDYCEPLYVVLDPGSGQILLRSETNQHDTICAQISDDDLDFSFMYKEIKYKIIYRIRQDDTNILTYFDFCNTVYEKINDVVTYRQVQFMEQPDWISGKRSNIEINILNLFSDEIKIKQNCLKMINPDIQYPLQQINIEGDDIILSSGLKDIEVQGQHIQIGFGCKYISFKGDNSVIGNNCQCINVMDQCSKIVIGDQCKEIQIKNACEKITILDKSQNIQIGNQCQNIFIGEKCGLNGNIKIYDNCFKQGKLVIGNNCAIGSGSISIFNDTGLGGTITIGNNCAQTGLISIRDNCAKNGIIYIGENCGSEFGSINILSKCACDGQIKIENNCGTTFGQITIKPMCAQKGGQITLGYMSGSGKNGFVDIGASSGYQKIDINLGQNQKLFIGTNVKKCLLTNSNDFDSANFVYFIKKDIESDLTLISEYQPVLNSSVEFSDMFDSFKPNVNFKIRM